MAECNAFSPSIEEAARYLETYKAYENKPPDVLKERVESDTSGARVGHCIILHHQVYYCRLLSVSLASRKSTNQTLPC